MITLKRRTILLVGGMLVPLLVLISCFNIYTLSVSNKRVHESALNVTSLYRRSAESDLQRLESIVLSFTSSSASYRQLRRVKDEYPLMSDVYEVSSRYSELCNSFSNICCIYFYSEANKIDKTVYGSGYSGQYEFKLQLQSKLKEMVRQSENPTVYGWTYIDVGNRSLLVRALGYGTLFTVCVIDPLLWPVPNNGYGSLVYADETGAFVSSSDFVQDNGFPLSPNMSSGYFISGKKNKYFISYEKSDYANTYLFYIKSYNGILGTLKPVQLVVLIATILLFFLIPFLVAEYNRTSFKPMDNLIKTMEKIRRGVPFPKMEENSKVFEFYVLCTTFNKMVVEIQDLKIESYEKELKQQRTYYALLQSQIRPHFYLNCLKTIQALAVEHNWQHIHDIVLNLSGYVRYLFRNTEELVPLKQEIESIENYIQLQNLITSSFILFIAESCPDTEKIMMPPLSILTFVENCIKHARLPDRNLKIGVKCIILKSGEESFLNISITDNGPGFPDTTVERLNKRKGIHKQGHIGIDNIVARIELTYGDNCSFMFSNSNHGACIDIFIPI